MKHTKAPETGASSHVHVFKPDPYTGRDELKCYCGAWQCKARPRGKTRCPDAAVNIKDFCEKHLKGQKHGEVQSA